MEVERKWFVIINPIAGRGRGLTDWPHISRLLRENRVMHDYAFTEYRCHASELAVEAVVQGYRKIIIVGGDGTIHEVVNGLFVQKAEETSRILLAVIAVGTGNDWIRMFGIPRKYSEAIRAIVGGHSFLQDVGRVSYYESNYRQTRYMANVAGVGLEAAVIKNYAHMVRKRRGGKWRYLWSLVKSVVAYRPSGMKVWVDGEIVANDWVLSATIGICKYNGGGMLQVPQAIPDDGLFDITVIRRMNLFRIVTCFSALFNGRIYDVRQASLYRGRKIRLEASPDVLLELDGELLGGTPVELEIIDKAVNVIVSEKYIKEKNRKDVSE